MAPAASQASSEEEEHVEDLVEIEPLTQQALVSAIKHRYVDARHQHRLIYTRAGAIVVALNPYDDGVRGTLYTREQRERYARAARRRQEEDKGAGGAADEEGALVPHIYEVASAAYESLRRRGRAQSIVINGESGAGKTETTKLLLQYLSEAAGAEGGIAERLLDSSPVLEAFGNAKTLRNDNSSRFGKLILLHFVAGGALDHASISHYLLEKSRVARQPEGEQTFHALYHLCAGAPPDLREQLQLGDASSSSRRFHTYLPPCSFRAQQLAHTFTSVDTKLSLILASDSDLAEAVGGGGGASARAVTDAFWRVLAAVMHVGRIVVDEDEDESADISGSVRADAVATAARLLGCEAEALAGALCKRRITVRGLETVLNRSAREAEVARDTLAKALYEKLFARLVEAVNCALNATDADVVGDNGDAHTREGLPSIGLLDIFGSEIFASNGFEQLLINYANDKLQQYFTTTEVERVMKVYREEAIDTSVILSSFEDVSPTINLLEGNPVSILSLLNDDTLYSDKALSRLDASASRDTQFASRLSVLEKTPGFVKTRPPNVGCVWDPRSGSFVKVQVENKEALREAHFAVKHFGSVVPYKVTGFSEKNADLLDHDLHSLLANCGSNANGSFTSALFSQAASRKRSVSAKFKDEMQSLIQTLDRSVGHFIRCIKPNDVRKPFELDEALTSSQLHSCGVLEAARVSQAGYPRRVGLRSFFVTFMGKTALSTRERSLRRKLRDEELRWAVRKLAVKVLGMRECVCDASVIVALAAAHPDAVGSLAEADRWYVEQLTHAEHTPRKRTQRVGGLVITRTSPAKPPPASALASESAALTEEEQRLLASLGGSLWRVLQHDGASDAVILAAVDADADAAASRNNKDELPLHAAVRRGASAAVIAALLRANPGAAAERCDGRLPLQLAVEHVDFAIGRTNVFLKRGVWARCQDEQQRRLVGIGEVGPFDPSVHAAYSGQLLTRGLRGVRLARILRRCQETVSRVLADKETRARLASERTRLEQEEEERRMRSERERAELEAKAEEAEAKRGEVLELMRATEEEARALLAAGALKDAALAEREAELGEAHKQVEHKAEALRGLEAEVEAAKLALTAQQAAHALALQQEREASAASAEVAARATRVEVQALEKRLADAQRHVVDELAAAREREEAQAEEMMSKHEAEMAAMQLQLGAAVTEAARKGEERERLERELGTANELLVRLEEEAQQAEVLRSELAAAKAQLKASEARGVGSKAELDAYVSQQVEAELASCVPRRVAADAKESRKDWEKLNVAYETLASEPIHWQRRGQAANPGKVSAAHKLSPVDQLRAMAARRFFTRAAELAEAKRKSLEAHPDFFGVDQAKVLAADKMHFSCRISAANMAKKVDAKAAVREYEEVLGSLRSRSSEPFTAELISKTETYLAEAQSRVGPQAQREGAETGNGVLLDADHPGGT